MILVCKDDIDRYLQEDRCDDLLNRFGRHQDENLICQKWLRQSAAKRYIYDWLYGDLFSTNTSAKVLDVGGGLTCLTRKLRELHDYNLVDLLAHDQLSMAKTMIQEFDSDFIETEDWYSLEVEKFEFVVANDIFPNVDQRLELFLDRYLPVSNKIRLSLTFYNSQRFYMTKRIDADEMLCMLSWNGAHLRSVMEKYKSKISSVDMDVFDAQLESVYPNGRQVCLLELDGDLL